MLPDLKQLYLREIATLERELDLYPDDASVWKELSANLSGHSFYKSLGAASEAVVMYINPRTRK